MKACKFLDDQWNHEFLEWWHRKLITPGFSNPDLMLTFLQEQLLTLKFVILRTMIFTFVLKTDQLELHGLLIIMFFWIKLVSQIGFSADDLQELVHSLPYVYQRSTTAISVVAPVYYAHLVVSQMSTFVKFDEMSDTTSSHSGGGGGSSSGFT